MTPRERRAARGQAVIPAALLALVVLVGALTWQARRTEASHRATAESALRDYAGIAAWQFSREAAENLHQIAHVTLSPVARYGRGRHELASLPDPASLFRFGDTTSCGIAPAARFAFRVDLAEGTMVTAGQPVDGATGAELVRRMTTAAGEATRRPDAVRLLVDTLGGQPRAIPYLVVRAEEDVPIAVYGLETDPSALVEHLALIADSKILLPPSLVKGRSLDSLLILEVRRPDGGVLLAVGGAEPEARDLTLASSDTMHADDGALVTTVALRPQAAGSLLIGGMPASSLPMHALLLVVSVAVAGLALVQLRRGRELARLRTRFVANVSHELRTPLAQISMFSETLLLARERSAEERQQFLSVIFREARRLSHLVESVLSFSRGEAQSARALRPAARNVAAEVRDAVRAFSPLAAAANVEIRTAGDGEAWGMVEPDALRQVLVNLLDNAVKFGPEGQRVTVSVERAGGEVLVAVDDRGPGIAPAHRRRVFEPFAQGDHPRARSGSGAGIGLAVVAELIAAHGGRVWIEDAPGGGGARVAFTVPAAVSSGTAAPAPVVAPERPLVASREREAVPTGAAVAVRVGR